MAVLELQAALQALYHHPDPSVKQQSNLWLQQWQQSQEAWQGAVAVLQAPEAGLEAQYFAAQTLRTKAQRDFQELAPSAALALRDSLLALMARFARAPAPVRTQLCLAAAALVARLPDQAQHADAAVTHALASLPSAPVLGLELLAALAEEADRQAGGGGRRAAVVGALLRRAGGVLGVLGEVVAQALLPGQPQPAEAAAAAAAALRCAEAWLALSAQPGGGCALTPGELLAQQPRLWGALLAAMTADEGAPEAAAAAAQALVALFSSSTFRGGDDADSAAFSSLFAHLLAALRPRLGTASEAAALALAHLASAAAERSPEAACGRGVPEAAPFAELMLECLGRPEAGVAEAGVDYFLMLNTVPLADRAPRLGAPLFQDMVGRLLAHATYPADAAFDPEEGDADDFARLREAVLPEALEVAYGLLRCAFLEQAWQLLRGATQWQAAEAALYCVGSVALPVRARASLAGNAGVAALEDARRTGELLAALFAELCAPDAGAAALRGHPALARALCWLLERYAPWFAKADEAPLGRALECVVAALRLRGAHRAAARALQVTCLRCAPRLRDPALVRALIEAAQPVAGSDAAAALTLDDRRAAVEGLARLAAGLPAAGDAEGAALAVVGPLLEEGRAGVAAGVGAPAARMAVAHSLSLLAAALRFLIPLSQGDARGGGGGSGPASAVLRAADGLLAAVAGSAEWRRDEEAAAALVEVYKQAVCSGRRAGAEVRGRRRGCWGAETQPKF
jgi:transportin-3